MKKRYITPKAVFLLIPELCQINPTSNTPSPEGGGVGGDVGDDGFGSHRRTDLWFDFDNYI